MFTRSSPSAGPSRSRKSLSRRAGRVAAVALAATACVTAMSPSASAIVNGQEATQRYPFMATLPQTAKFPTGDGETIDVRAQCGASLITSRWLVTAAHCVNPEALDGIVRIGSDDRESGGTVRHIKRTVTHPAYDVESDPSTNDIALVELDRPVSEKPIRIAKSVGRPGTPTRLLGFGTVRDTDYLPDAVFPDKLKQLDTRIGAVNECSPGRADKTRICTISKTPGAMACFGDSGGPQIQHGRDGRWELVGATSGDGDTDPTCGTGPGMYTNVPAYSKWIDRTIHSHR
ncbi:S1 family peptidase [Streptomyces sp. NPDC058239]|uniref:S1 family peptidase n=1 Tax=Streptomyces sp. NPDC058239 TaxID=3346395 RepID=UPI0036E0E046